MRRSRRIAAAALAWALLTGFTLPPSKHLAPFEPLRASLMRRSRASVSSTCGASTAPWAYRGRYGQQTMLRPFVTAHADAEWVRAFVTTLMRAHDWDSLGTGSGIAGAAVPCEGATSHTQVAVGFEGDPDVYALVFLDTREAAVFEAGRPLGRLRFADRADSLLALLRTALADDPAIPTELPPVPTPFHAPGDSVYVQVLPEAIGKVPPSYPDYARNHGIDGLVVIQALVGKRGTVEDAFVLQSIPALDDAALDAVWQWRFKPASANGDPLAVWVSVPVKFTLH